MDSHEVMRRAVTGIGAKAVAGEMSLSTSLIYKWCEDSAGPEAAGADKPLDRIARICSLTGDVGPIEWLSQQADGFFVKNTDPTAEKRLPLLQVTQRILSEFTDMLGEVSSSVENDGRSDEGEAERIRAEWEDLKSISESFVVACEKGAYANSAMQ